MNYRNTQCLAPQPRKIDGVEFRLRSACVKGDSHRGPHENHWGLTWKRRIQR